MKTLGILALVAGVAVVGFVAYRMFFAKDSGKRWGESLRETEQQTPALRGALQKAGVDIHKLEGALDPHQHHTSKANYGKFMSYF